MQQIKRSWFIAKLYKNAAVADPLANYTLLDYGFELIDNYVNFKWFDGEQVPQGTDDDDAVMEHSDNEYVEEEDEVTDDEESEDGDSDGDDDDMDDSGLISAMYLLLL